ncbi:uncharacterized protein [Diadema setosum]|uniref:uncharacterized protein n=1 Tax=Diadema setosum TaxID=31175 RepID=UPI003B3ACCC3
MGTPCGSRGMPKLIMTSVLFTYLLPGVLMQSVFTEGQDALVEYTFPDIAPQSVAVEIRKGSTILFDKTGKKNLNAQQANRIKISTEARGDNTVVRLSITNITREDESAYLCVLYDSQGTMVLETQKNHISVEFPPGLANCSSTESSEVSVQNYLGSDDTWTVIKCQATRGTQSGYLACFNPDLRLPPLSNHFNRTHLIGMFWTKKDKPVFCCSATFENGMDKCKCMEYKSHMEQVLCSPKPNSEESDTCACPADVVTLSIKPHVSTVQPATPSPFQEPNCQDDTLQTLKFVEKQLLQHSHYPAVILSLTVAIFAIVMAILLIVSVSLNKTTSHNEQVSGRGYAIS